MTSTEKFLKFREVYADRQANRPKVNGNSTEKERADARRYAKASVRGLERFLQKLSSAERRELRDTLDRGDAFTDAILRQAEDLYYV